ncbi:MAG TPA: PEP/pyruvate-binding domain-containing protein [Candidatus Paceibacterota bacterium]|nr:PEP/pyruvate-binding domain-containing protein [Verrucomicrobiota bacterium]HRY48575.1 PEP/pyruvate-binding domain-containing protein [Candidatus Paceibacterota bacterium]
MRSRLLPVVQKLAGAAGVVTLLFFLSAAPHPMRGESVSLQARWDASNGWPRVSSAGEENRVHTLQRSADLARWSDAAVLHGGPFDYADASETGQGCRFYRLLSRDRTDRDDGKNQILWPEDDFYHWGGEGLESMRWVKFTLLLEDPTRVWFQDSSKYPFHYDYARDRIPGFAGMSRAQFDAATLRTNQQKAVLGAVILPSDPQVSEYGIQLVGLDRYPAEQVIQWLRWIEAAILPLKPAKAIYIPTWEQIPDQNSQALFAQAGITVSQAERWQRLSVCYSGGWALGRLVYVPAGEIDAAYATGRLLSTDILLTDGIPAEIPYLAGLISLVPATPNSHVAILARSYGIPFVYISDAAERAQIQSHVDHEVLLRVWDRFLCEVSVTPIVEPLEPAFRAQIMALKTPGPVNYTPKAFCGTLFTNVDNLVPADIRFFGGKAANFGVLRRHLPTNSPVAIAFSFDLWDAFLDQVLPKTGRTLREEIRFRTRDYQYPPDIGAVRIALSGIRDLIRDEAIFSAPQQAAILEALSGFSPARKIRFRSSTNVEDSEQFTGAGLYDSYSGCLADDLDDNQKGPSLCDPLESAERGVFRALKRVYASFYNENAWLERLRFGLNEDDLGMAVLAHYSFPDEEEMANGVATLRYERIGASKSYNIQLVTQLGAVSVTNPEGDFTAEVVEANQYDFGYFATTRIRSSLVPLGGNVLVWEGEYKALVRLLQKATEGYAALYPDLTVLELDFEYKKVEPGVLVVKQIRRLPATTPPQNITPFLINEPTTLCVQQGEQGDVFANHRLKCQLSFSTRNLQLTPANLAVSFYTNVVFHFRVDAHSFVLTNGFGAWPGSGHAVQEDTVVDRWPWGSGAEARAYELVTSIAPAYDNDQVPFLTPGQLRATLRVTYSQPVPTLGYEGPTNTLEETVVLAVCPPVTPRSIPQERVLGTKGRLKVTTSFYWPEPPQGPTAGYTAPLIQWTESRIFGLTADPIVLHADASQSYHPGHHNFWEEFIFEPRLDPAVPTAQLEELKQKNIQFIYASYSDFETAFYAMGFDGKLRRLP